MRLRLIGLLSKPDKEVRRGNSTSQSVQTTARRQAEQVDCSRQVFQGSIGDSIQGLLRRSMRVRNGVRNICWPCIRRAIKELRVRSQDDSFGFREEPWRIKDRPVQGLERHA